MVFFGHIGPSLFIGRKAVGPERFDLKAAVCIAIWAELPDLIDKPIRLLHLISIPSGRLWGHTLLFSLLCVLLVRIFLKSQWPWVLATPGHLVLDSMWGGHYTLFWPLAGFTFDLPDYCPMEVLQQGYLAFYNWRWHHEPLIIISTILGEAAGLILTYAALKPLFPKKT